MLAFLGAQMLGQRAAVSIKMKDKNLPQTYHLNGTGGFRRKCPAQSWCSKRALTPSMKPARPDTPMASNADGRFYSGAK